MQWNTVTTLTWRSCLFNMLHTSFSWVYLAYMHTEHRHRCRVTNLNSEMSTTSAQASCTLKHNNQVINCWCCIFVGVASARMEIHNLIRWHVHERFLSVEWHEQWRMNECIWRRWANDIYYNKICDVWLTDWLAEWIEHAPSSGMH